MEDIGRSASSKAIFFCREISGGELTLGTYVTIVLLSLNGDNPTARLSRAEIANDHYLQCIVSVVDGVPITNESRLFFWVTLFVPLIPFPSHVTRNMVELSAIVKGTVRKFQLQAEVVALEFEASKRKRAFGVELFDLIEKQRINMRAQIEKTLEETESKTPQDVQTFEKFLTVFQTIENEIRKPLEACRTDVAKMSESHYLPILIQRRKEDFGVEIWPIVTSPKWLHESLEGDLKKAFNEKTVEQKNQLENLVKVAMHGVIKGTKTTITKAIGKLSPEQREVENLVKISKRDVAVFEEQKIAKMREMEELYLDGVTLECCAA